MTATTNRHVLVWPEQGVEMAFRLIPAGSFRMGSRGYSSEEEPIHQVRIEEPFWMGETPVTQEQFSLWTVAEKAAHENHFKGHPKHPAEDMDWRQAVSFCSWLTKAKATELPEDFGIACLPTEAEWEYACRAGTDTEYYTGDGAAALDEAGWFDEEFESGSTHPVGQKTPNDFGLYDMHGNVGEWCHDVWDEFAYRNRTNGCVDPCWQLRIGEWHAGLETMVKSDRVRVVRGGSWDGSTLWCRSACRGRFRRTDRIWVDGFRVCLVRGSAR